MLGLDQSPKGLLHLPPLLLCGGGDGVTALVLDGQGATPDVQLQLVCQLHVIELVAAVRVAHDVRHGQPDQENHLKEDLREISKIAFLDFGDLDFSSGEIQVTNPVHYISELDVRENVLIGVRDWLLTAWIGKL